jgi:hypothetical protein
MPGQAHLTPLPLHLMRVYLGLPSSPLHLANLGLELEDWSQQHLPPAPPAHKTRVNAPAPVEAHVHPSTLTNNIRAPKSTLSLSHTHSLSHANEARYGGCDEAAADRDRHERDRNRHSERDRDRDRDRERDRQTES